MRKVLGAQVLGAQVLGAQVSGAQVSKAQQTVCQQGLVDSVNFQHVNIGITAAIKQSQTICSRFQLTKMFPDNLDSMHEQTLVSHMIVLCVAEAKSSPQVNL